MSANDEALSTMAGIVVRRIIGAYANHRITREECLRQLREEAGKEIAGMCPIPQYRDWLEVAVAEHVEKCLPQKLGQV